MKRFLLALLLVATSVQAQWPGYSFRPSGSGGASAFSDLTGSATCAQLPALTGDATTSAGSCATTLASVVSAGGPTGSATVAPIITYDAKGRLTTVSSATITPAVGDITGLGTGVATALAVNVGSAGAPVVLNGALGTPSSGTLTNATGLPAAGVVGTAAILGANTFTALQTITQATANAGILASTGYSLTGSNATNMIDLAGTWNTTGNPSAIKLSISHTAAGASSKYIDILGGAAGTTQVMSLMVNALGEGLLSVRSFNATAMYGSSGNFFKADSSITGVVAFGVGGDVGASNPNARLTGPAAAVLQQGAADVAGAPVAQTLRAQSASGVSNTAGADWNLQASAGTGSAAGGAFIVQVAPASGSGSTKNAYVNALKISTTALTLSTVVTAASSGTRYLCIDTAGVVTSSASACSGT